MLTQLCQELRNWFDRGQEKYIGRISIDDEGHMTCTNVNIENVPVQTGQYFRVVGSVFNDGVHQEGDSLSEETFDGAIWLMAIPQAVIDLAEDISAWQDKYGGVDSVAMSPYSSESFGGYSYTKSGGGSASYGSMGGTWQAVFFDRLKCWRKI